MTTTAEPVTTIDSTIDTPGWLLTADELAATRTKLDKINTRARNRGFTGQLTLAAAPETHTRTVAGCSIDGVMWRTRITGDAPCYGGWRVLATITNDRHAGPIINTIPGTDDTTLDYANITSRATTCEHCHTRRNRRNLYLLQNTTSGEVKIVGKTCLQDFCGWHATPVIFTNDDLNDLFTGVGSTPVDFTPETILSVAVAAVDAYGFVPASSTGLTTATVVRTVLGLTKNNDAATIMDTVGAHYEHAEETATTILNWLRSPASNDASTYMHNLRAIAVADHVSTSQINRLVSAVQAHHRWTADTQRSTREQDTTAPSVHIGTVGEKITVAVTIESVIWINDDYSFTGGVKPLYVMRDHDHNAIKWFASRSALPTEPGTQLTITGTVKKHDCYTDRDGVTEAQTILTRCKRA